MIYLSDQTFIHELKIRKTLKCFFNPPGCRSSVDVFSQSDQKLDHLHSENCTLNSSIIKTTSCICINVCLQPSSNRLDAIMQMRRTKPAWIVRKYAYRVDQGVWMQSSENSQSPADANCMPGHQALNCRRAPHRCLVLGVVRSPSIQTAMWLQMSSLLAKSISQKASSKTLTWQCFSAFAGMRSWSSRRAS